jgi:hypothetical protein
MCEIRFIGSSRLGRGSAMTTQYTCPQCGQTDSTAVELDTCRACGHVSQIRIPLIASIDPGVYQLSGPPLELSAPRPSDVEPPQRQFPSESRWVRWVRPWALETSRVSGMGICLVALSTADLFMTFTLLQTSPRFIEANPIAQWFYSHWDMMGLVYFKFSIIGGVILVSEIIERHRPGWGRFVLLVGCVGAAYAFIQGLRLYVDHGLLAE